MQQITALSHLATDLDMTADNNPLAANRELQFDRVETAAPGAPSVACSKCSRAITTYYYTVDDASICSLCKRTLEMEQARRKAGMMRAALYGVGAAIAGAVIYYGVIAITNLEIGIVALLIGYMVGYAVRSGAGRGGRRFQLLAAGLTYVSVGMAYSPLALGPILNGRAASLLSKQNPSAKSARVTPPVAADQSTDSASATNPQASAPTTAARTRPPIRPRRMTLRIFVLGLGALALFVTVLPIFAVLGSMPSGLISALIIGIGMRRAWKMTAETGTEMPGATIITGPFRVGRPATAASA
jgi:predicted nucleic acid-binding Zn ribbon protein